MKTYTYRFLFFLFLLPLHTALAQSSASVAQGRISGTLVEAGAGKPVGFANVVLLSLPDSSLTTGATTGIDGTFLLERVPAGRYVLRASMVGYPNRFVPDIRITPAQPRVALGNIALKARATQLSEVEVTAERALVEYALDKRVVNVSQDINAQSGSVAEVMQNLPSVTVDIDGNVSMRGSANVTVLVDGKRSSLSSIPLDQIPANLIESIELVTNPSSKYNPEGTSGIINLVLKKERKPGFNGSASVTAGTYDNYNTSLNLNYRYSKWSLNGGYDYRQRSRPGSSDSFTENYYLDSLTNRIDSTSYRVQDGARSSLDVSHSFRLGADYYLTPRHTLSASALYRPAKDEDENDILYHFLDENRQLQNTSRRTSAETEDEQAMDLTLGYRQTFAQKGQELTADAVYTTNVDEEESIFRQTQVNASPEQLPQVQRTFVDDANTRFVTKADYVYPYSEDSRLEAGFRTSYEQLDEDSRFFDLDNTTDQLVYNAVQSNHFVYDEQVYSVYGNYSNKFGSVSVQAGVRAEQTLTKADQRTTDEVFRNDYFSLFPTFFITNDFNKDNKVQFSYSRRINRPRSRFLNPFVDQTDQYNTRFGNPQLRPEFINSLELGYLRYWGDISFNSSLFFRHTTDEIDRFRTATVVVVDGEEVPGTQMTFLNLSSNISYGLELGLNYPVTKWWRFNANFSGFQTQLSSVQGDTELSSSLLSWNTKVNSNMTVWKNLDLQLSAFYRAPSADIQGRREQMFSTDFAMKKDVLNKKGTVSLRVSDVFNTRQFNFLNYGPTFRTDAEYKRQSQVVYLGFTYRINSDNNQNSRRQRNEQGPADSDDGFE
ncbi:TonB-dependent receptor [Pontibacter sp. E15-1]|uniref:outer membrane beta-barrel family protein n=1 Tax=Pontibacter sp. E15-1 TaxID=2919918 RepID=UPI001F4F2B9A|nr:outer membrane beta-barrel family protein [Pontibacter sp. E15-1]MCJ8165518.1 TonB-dependent receptor [Pontibacter sp. E15-1]